MNRDFYIELTYRIKGQDDTVSHPVESGLYIENYAWDETARILFIGNNMFQEVTHLQIWNHAGTQVVKYSDAVNKLMAR